MRYRARTRDRRAGCKRVRSEGLGGLPVAREALVWSVRSVPAAGAETPFEVRLRRVGRLDRSACVTDGGSYGSVGCRELLGRARRALGTMLGGRRVGLGRLVVGSVAAPRRSGRFV